MDYVCVEGLETVEYPQDGLRMCRRIRNCRVHKMDYVCVDGLETVEYPQDGLRMCGRIRYCRVRTRWTRYV